MPTHSLATLLARQLPRVSNNTIIGSYNGNQNGLDIRTSSNNIVLSDGDGNCRQVIKSDGTVLWGPGEVNTSSYTNAAAFVTQSTNSPYLLFNTDYSGGTLTMLQFQRNSSAVGSINTSATATAYNTSSDHRLKENVVSMTGATARQTVSTQAIQFHC